MRFFKKKKIKYEDYKIINYDELTKWQKIIYFIKGELHIKYIFRLFKLKLLEFGFFWYLVILISGPTLVLYATNYIKFNMFLQEKIEIIIPKADLRNIVW